MLAIFLTQLAASPLSSISIDQRLGDSLPLDATFVDDAGNSVSLRDCVRGRPALLTFVTFRCKRLCPLTLNQLTRGLVALTESAGEKFDVIAVGLDERETSADAADAKRTYLRAYRRESATDGFHFLVGPQRSIDAVTAAAGFHYRGLDHASAVLVVTPSGRISRYFLANEFPPTELREAMARAADERGGSPTENVLTYCTDYDPTSARNGKLVTRSLQVSGVLSVLGLGTFIGVCAIRERRRSRAAD